MNRIHSLPRLFFVCLLFTATYLSMLPAWAQPPAPSSPPASALPPTALPQADHIIGISTLVTQIDEDESLLQRIQTHVDSPETYGRLSYSLDNIANAVDEKLRAFTQQELLHLPVMRLESLERNWTFDAHRLAQWRDDMRDYGESYFIDAADLSKRLDKWLSIRTKLKASDLPKALLERIDVLIAELTRARDVIAAPLSQQIELRRRASGIEARIHEGQRITALAIDSIDHRLFKVDVPPLWAAQPAYDGLASIDAIRDGLEIELRFSKEYKSSVIENYSLPRLLQYLLLPLVVWMAWLHRRKLSAEDNPAENQVLNRPLSLYLLLSMAIILTFRSGAPQIMLEAVMLLVIIPTLRLLPQTVYQKYKFWPYLIAMLYVLSRIGYFLTYNITIYRLFLLAMALTTLGVVAWRIWYVRHEKEATRAQYNLFIRSCAWLALLLMVVSVVANLFGNVSLAAMLVNGLVISSYAVLVLCAIVNAGNGLLDFMLKLESVKNLRLIRMHSRDITHGVSRLATIAAVSGWIIFITQSFRIFRPIYALISDILTSRIEIGELSLSLGDIGVFIIAVFIAFWTARIVKILLRDEMLPRMSLPRGVGNSISTLSYYGILLIGLMLGLSAAGFKVNQLALIFGALGVGIGFGLQNIVANLVSGLILMLERPIQPGDVIEVANASGKVSGIGLRATTVRTSDGADVVLPNNMLLAGSLTNWTMLDRRRRFEIPVAVGYEADPRQVQEILAATARDTPDIAPAPAPEILFQQRDSGTMQFTIRAWTDEVDTYLNVRSELTTRIHQALADAGIPLPRPQQELHLHTLPEAASAAPGQSK